ncbi:unnamed protein product [Penicillium salamii]|nr:unnamed protein product [Penicillium salamii]CAG8151807.1 unnamed protein product [Penicillium salamii]CAG8402505.1 unnamed protein product [Penicillium salamii]
MNDGDTDTDHREHERPAQPDRDVRPWVPWTLRRPFLCSLAGLFLIFGIILEVLRQVPERKHGLVIYKTVEEMPKIISGVYIYVPVTMAVVAVTLWQFCAADALRLEPYFQLAKPEGVSATALFTNYTFRPDAMAPIVAVCNRHWLILLISTLSVGFRISLPSLLSGLVVLTEAELKQAYNVTTWPKLLDEDTQESWFAAQTVRETNHSMIRTTDEFLLYRSIDYATAAVSMPIDENETSVLSINQTVYWSELSCQNSSLTNITWQSYPTESDISNLRQWRTEGVSFPSGHEDSACIVNFTLNTTKHQQDGAFQLRYWEPILTQSVSSQGPVFGNKHCEDYALLGLFVDIDEGSQKSAGHISNATAFACSAKYQSAEAQVKLGVDASISEVEVNSSTIKELQKSQFFDEGFREFLYDKMSLLDYSNSQTRKASTKTSLNYQSSRPILDLDQSGLSPAVDLLEYQNQVARFWKSEFTIAMNKLFDVTISTNVEASQATTFVVLDVLSKPAVTAEMFLLTAVLLLLLLVIVYPRRPNFLQSDPGSIVAQCAVVADLFTHENPLTKFDNKFSHATSQQLRRWAKNFKCQWTDGPNGRKIDIVPVCSNMSPAELALPLSRRHTDRRPHFVILPWFLAECVLLMGTVVTYGLSLSAFSVRDINYRSNKQFGFMVFLLFGPTLISSLVSSLLASVLRSLTIIETWGRLQKGRASLQKTLAKNYGSHIPLSILFHNICQGPAIPIALSIICTLGLFHTIVSGGMFESQNKAYSEKVTNLYDLSDNTSFRIPTSDLQFDGIGLMLNHLNRGTPIFPWQDDQHAFLPMSFSDIKPEITTVDYTAVTTGIGADPRCRQIYLDQPRIDHLSGLQSWNYTNPSGLTCTMQDQNATKGAFIKRSISYLQPDSVSSMDPSCQSAVVVLARWDTMMRSPMNTQNYIALACDVSIAVRQSEVTFSGDGTVLSSRPTKDSTVHNMSHSEVAHFNGVIMSYTKPYTPLGNASFFHLDWAGMMTVAQYDRHHASSQLSFEPEYLITAVQSTYQQIFRAYLSFNMDLYYRAYTGFVTPNVAATKVSTTWGLFPSPVSIIMAMVLLSLDVVMVIIVFTARSTYFRAPRIPTTLGSLIPWIANSNMISDFRELARIGKSKSQIYQVQSERQYRFGLSDDGTDDGRWLLDYDHSNLEDIGHELDQFPHWSSASRFLRGRFSQSHGAGDVAIASSTQRASYTSRFTGYIGNLIKRRAKRHTLPP